MCGVGEQMRKKQQRLLKNMDAHKVMLDLLQIPYDKVTWRPARLLLPVFPVYRSPRASLSQASHLPAPLSCSSVASTFDTVPPCSDLLWFFPLSPSVSGAWASNPEPCSCKAHILPLSYTALEFD